MEIVQKKRYAPNLNASAQKLLKSVMAPRLTFDRPVSVERERQLIQRRKARRTLYLGFIIVALGAWIGVASRNGRLSSIVTALRSKLGI